MNHFGKYDHMQSFEWMLYFEFFDIWIGNIANILDMRSFLINVVNKHKIYAFLSRFSDYFSIFLKYNQMKIQTYNQK